MLQHFPTAKRRNTTLCDTGTPVPASSRTLPLAVAFLRQRAVPACLSLALCDRCKEDVACLLVLCCACFSDTCYWQTVSPRLWLMCGH